MKKVTLLALVVSILMIVGCTPQNAEKKETKSIVLYTFNQNKERADVIQGILDQFSTEHPEINVQMKEISGGDKEELKKLKELHEGNEQADLLWLPPSLGISEAAISKYIQPLDEYSDSLGLSNFYVSTDNLRYNGELYAIPFIYEHYLIYYNKDLFDKYQLKYPSVEWSYDDFANSATKLTNVGNNVVGIENGQLLYYAIGGAYGGGTFKEDNTQLTLGEDGALQGYELLTKLFKEKKIDGRISETLSQGFAVEPNFRNGTAGMMINSSALLTSNFEKVPHFGVVPFPKGPSNQQGVSSLETLAISSKSNYKKESAEVLTYLSTATEARKSIVKSGVSLPTTSDEQVFDTFNNLFSDSSYAEVVRQVLNSNKDTLGIAPNTPGYSNVLIKLTGIFMDPMNGLYSGNLEVKGEFKQKMKQLNESWLLEQQTNWSKK